MTYIVKPPLEDLYLEHFGVKGMRWGVRKDRNSSSENTKVSKKEPRYSAETKQKATMVALGAGALVVGVGSVFVARKLSRWRELTKANSPDEIMRSHGEDYVKSRLYKHAIKDDKILHVSSGRELQYRILRTGGYEHPFKEYLSNFDDFKSNAGPNLGVGLKKVKGGRIAATIRDPEGRTDKGGRTIIQQILIPKSLASGIKTEDDVVKKIWPQVKDLYAKFYPESTGGMS